MNVATRLPHHPTSVSKARHAIDGLEAAVDEETVATVRLLVSELVSNSVRHARPEESSEIELSVRASSKTVRVEVADSGPGFDAQPRTGDHDQGSGWGLHLVELLSHRWGTAREAGMRIWFEIDHPAAAEAAAIRNQPFSASAVAQTTLSSPPASDATSARNALESVTR